MKSAYLWNDNQLIAVDNVSLDGDILEIQFTSEKEMLEVNNLTLNNKHLTVQLKIKENESDR